MSMMMVSAALNRARQILDAGELSAGGSVLKIRGELSQLSRFSGVALRCRLLRRRCEIRRDLRRDLRVLRRIRLLKVLQFAQHLRERRELIAVLG